jgi:hypothetical protein
VGLLATNLALLLLFFEADDGVFDFASTCFDHRSFETALPRLRATGGIRGVTEALALTGCSIQDVLPLPLPPSPADARRADVLCLAASNAAASKVFSKAAHSGVFSCSTTIAGSNNSDGSFYFLLDQVGDKDDDDVSKDESVNKMGTK